MLLIEGNGYDLNMKNIPEEIKMILNRYQKEHSHLINLPIKLMKKLMCVRRIPKSQLTMKFFAINLPVTLKLQPSNS